MTRYTPGEVVFVGFPHSSGTATVNRPALVVIDTGDQDVVARITTEAHATTHDVVIAIELPPDPRKKK